MGLSRRNFWGLAALAACIPFRPSLASGVADDRNNKWHRIRVAPGVDSFADLKKWVEDLPNEQRRGSPTAVCKETGQEYTELFVYGLARPGDEAVVERDVATQMQQKICRALTDRVNSTIYWRIPLEWEIDQRALVVEYREDGPDLDFVTNERCVTDKNWMRVAAYCRLALGKE